MAGFYFLPETTGNILALAKRYEAKVPLIWDAHQRLQQDIEKLKETSMKEVEEVERKLRINKT